jgi:hypothetical protein
MKLMHKLALSAVMLALTAGLFFAQTPPTQNNAVQRTILDRADSSIAGREKGKPLTSNIQ